MMIAPAIIWVKRKIQMEIRVLLLQMEEKNSIVALLITWFVLKILNSEMVHALQAMLLLGIILKGKKKHCLSYLKIQCLYSLKEEKFKNKGSESSVVVVV